MYLSRQPARAQRLLPAFLSFLFLNTDTITSRFPITSTTMVVISTPASTVTTQGKDWCCWPGAPSSPAGVVLRGTRVPSTMVGSWSSRDISCGRCLGSTSRIGSWSRRVGPFSITHGVSGGSQSESGWRGELSLYNDVILYAWRYLWDRIMYIL